MIIHKDPYKDRYNRMDAALSALRLKFHGQVCTGAPSCVPECAEAQRVIDEVGSARSR